MAVREEEKLGSRQSAALKAQARAEKRARAVQLAAEGLSPTVIGRRLRMDGRTVAEWLRAEGVRYATRAGRGGLASLPDGPPC